MKQFLSLYEYLCETYKPNEPIFLSDICMNYEDPGLRKAFSKLVKQDKLVRYDNGIYYIPTKTEFGISSLNPLDVIEKKFLIENKKICGYYSGAILYNSLGFTSQVPFSYDIVTNKATTEYRETTIKKLKLIIRKPKAVITPNNYHILQFLDVMKDIDIFSEIDSNELKNNLEKLINNYNLTYKKIEPYLDLYPEKIYKNLVKTGVINNGLLA